MDDPPSLRFTGGHTNTERGYLPVLANKLREEIQRLQNAGEFAIYEDADKVIVRQMEVYVSTEDKDPLQFV